MSKISKKLIIIISILFLCLIFGIFALKINKWANIISSVAKSAENYVENQYSGNDFYVSGLNFNDGKYTVILKVKNNEMIEVGCLVYSTINSDWYNNVKIWYTSNIDLIKTNTKFTYVNKNLGFKLTFPDNWKDYYKVSETNNGIVINFYGKSLTGRGETIHRKDGLIMFYVLNQEALKGEMYDSITKIGTARGVDYYFATGTGFDLEPIALIDDEIIKQLLEIYGSEFYGDSQIPIIKADWEKAQKMQNDIKFITDSFTEI